MALAPSPHLERGKTFLRRDKSAMKQMERGRQTRVRKIGKELIQREKKKTLIGVVGRITLNQEVTNRGCRRDHTGSKRHCIRDEATRRIDNQPR